MNNVRISVTVNKQKIMKGNIISIIYPIIQYCKSDETL